MRTWLSHVRALRDAEMQDLQAQESGLAVMERIIRKLKYRKLYHGSLLIRMVQEARGVEIADARVQSERKQQLHVAGSEMLARIFGRDVPRRHVQQAFDDTVCIDMHATSNALGKCCKSCEAH